ncbi:MAG: hypothetical protein ABFD24_01580 [Anaerolineaceae bacterium]
MIKKLQPLWAFLFYCLTTIFMTYPLAFHLSDSVIGGTGDNMYFLWLVKWYQQVILSGKWHPFFNPWMNYPQGWNLSTTDTSLASTLPGVPFSMAFGPIAGYNIALLLTFVLSGFFMYLWVRRLTKSEAAALIAGALFAFSPNHMARLVAGHLNLCAEQWFPLYFWGLFDLLNPGKKFNWWTVLLTSLGLGAIAFTTMYYLYMTLIITLLIVLVYLILTRFKALGKKVFWVQLTATVVIALPFLFFSLRPFVTLSEAGGIASRSLEYANVYSASPTDFLLPSTDHFLWGAAIGKAFDRSLWMEGTLYLGAVGLLLAAIAIVLNKKSENRWLIWAGLAAILTSVVLAMGIQLHWNNQVVIWQVPPFLQQLLHRTQTPISLPSAWLFTHLPFYDKMRALMRFGVFATVFVPLLAGLGFDILQRRWSGKVRTLLTVILIALILFDFYPGSYAKQLSQPKPRAVDLWLAGQPADGAVVQMPFTQSTDQVQLYYSLFFNKPFVGGFFNANQPSQYQNIQPTLDAFPDANSIELLHQLKVKYIVVDQSAYSDFASEEALMEKLGLVEMVKMDNEVVFTFDR